MLTSNFSQRRQSRGIDDNVHEALLQQLLRVENRTYLWVALIFPEIERCAGLSEKKLLEVIRTIPTTVNEVYENILSRSTDPAVAKRLLEIVLAAAHPLTLDELNVALAINDNSRCLGDLDLEPPVTFKTTVRDLCGLLVNIRDSRVHLIHQTAREFLLAPNRSRDCRAVAYWQHSLNIVESHVTLAKICIAFLKFLDLEASSLIPRRSTLKKATTEYLVRYPFLYYAANNWHRHVRSFEPWDCRENKEILLSICNPNSKECQTWFQIHRSITSSYIRLLKGFNEFTMAVYLDLVLIFDLLSHNGIRPDTTDCQSRNALWWALRKGNDLAACELLTKYMVSEDFDALAALQMASLLGYADVVDCLLANFDVDGYKIASDGWTAIRRTASHGHVRVLDILLKNNPDKAPPEIKEMALYYAAGQGHIDMVEYLLDQDINVDARSVDGETALYRCVANRNIELTKLLLQRGANPDSLTANPWNEEGHVFGETALYEAVSVINKSMVKLLLDCGAKVEAKSRHSETALYRAAGARGWDGADQGAIVRLLVEQGADIDAKTGTGDTPLRRALRAGYGPVIKIMKGSAKALGLETTLIVHSSREGEFMRKARERHSSIIEASDLLNADGFMLQLKSKDVDDGSDRDLSRKILCKLFGDMAQNVDLLRDAM